MSAVRVPQVDACCCSLFALVNSSSSNIQKMIRLGDYPSGWRVALNSVEYVAFSFCRRWIGLIKSFSEKTLLTWLWGSLTRLWGGGTSRIGVWRQGHMGHWVFVSVLGRWSQQACVTPSVSGGGHRESSERMFLWAGSKGAQGSGSERRYGTLYTLHSTKNNGADLWCTSEKFVVLFLKKNIRQT